MYSFPPHGSLDVCPDCYRQSLAHPRPMLYKCLKCGFKHNLSHQNEMPFLPFLIPFMLLFFLL